MAMNCPQLTPAIALRNKYTKNVWLLDLKLNWNLKFYDQELGGLEN